MSRKDHIWCRASKVGCECGACAAPEHVIGCGWVTWIAAKESIVKDATNVIGVDTGCVRKEITKKQSCDACVGKEVSRCFYKIVSICGSATVARIVAGYKENAMVGRF